MVSPEFDGLDAGEIKRRPETERVLAARDTRPEVMREILGWVTEVVD